MASARPSDPTLEAVMNPIALCMIRRLLLPYVYKGRRWPSAAHSVVHVLAIDRAGRGDPHVVLYAGGVPVSPAVTQALDAIPAAYRWLAFYSPKSADSERMVSEQPRLGSGTLGLIEVIPMALEQLGANVLVPANRADFADQGLVEQYTEVNRPDIRY